MELNNKLDLDNIIEAGTHDHGKSLGRDLIVQLLNNFVCQHLPIGGNRLVCKVLTNSFIYIGLWS